MHAREGGCGDRAGTIRFTRRPRSPTDACIGSLDGGVYAFARQPAILWAHPTGGYVYASPAVWRKRVLVGSYDHRFYAFDAGTGDVLWRFDANRAISGAATVIDGLVYFSTFSAAPTPDAANAGRSRTWPDGKY